MTEKLTGIFGGTFDPIHQGHLHVAKALWKMLPLKKIRFIPCDRPAHRDETIASASDRLAMLKLALKHEENFIADDIEIKRTGISYTIDTLATLKTNHPEAILCLILGIDAFEKFTGWDRGEKILSIAHLIVVNRPGYDLINNAKITMLLKQHKTENKSDLLNSTHGKIYTCYLPPSDISATNIRNQLLLDHAPTDKLAPEVLTYIQNHRLYLPCLNSSTEL